MRLTKNDKQLLKKWWGAKEEDIKQIERASRSGTLVLTKIDSYNEKYHKRITQREAINLIGREAFLSGLERAASHCSSVKYNGSIGIYFDCRKFFLQ